MKWLGITVSLLLASGCLGGWIYLRDRDPAGWRPPERALARADAVTVLDESGGAGCHTGCNVELLRHLAPRRWLARITIRAQRRCFEIGIDTFSASQRHGLTGVLPVTCPAAGG